MDSESIMIPSNLAKQMLQRGGNTTNLSLSLSRAFTTFSMARHSNPVPFGFGVEFKCFDVMLNSISLLYTYFVVNSLRAVSKKF